LFQRQKEVLSFDSLSDAQQQQCLIQINRDLSDRAIVGVIYYLVVWFGVVLLLDDLSNNIELKHWVYVISSVITVTSVLRGAMIYWAKKCVEKIQLSRALLLCGLVSTSLSWGVISSLSFLDTPIAFQQDLMIIATMGLCAGGAISLCASRLLLAIFLATMLLPTLVIEVFFASEMYQELVLIYSLFFVGLLSATKPLYREYLTSLVSYLKLEEISNTDQLSGIGNRRFFDTQLDEEIRRCQRNQNPLSLLIIDIDHFKSINDHYGHPIGDKCIKQIAERLQLSIQRVSDTVSRFGGEEFAIILPGLPIEQSHIFAEKIRKAISSEPFEFDGQRIQITTSIGCCTLSEVTQNDSAALIVSKADEALYNAKRLGRNRVELALPVDANAL
jgi:diguanylate cyclase (GGDEF)-like protein